MVAAPDPIAAATLVRHARAAGRLRLAVPALRDDGALAARIEASVRARPGVSAVRASARSGRVLIECRADAPMLAELERIASGQAPRRAAAAGAGPQLAWHALGIAEVAARLATDAHAGLTAAAARERLAAGANVIAAEAPPSRLRLAASQLANLPAGLLLGSALVSVLLGDVFEAGAIATVVVINAGIGYRVERTSERLLASWRETEAGTAAVIRDRSIGDVPAGDLVPGDLLVLRAGDVVAADARVCDAHRLAADEAALTGESEPVAKRADPCVEGAVLAERACMLYRGTRIAAGRGRAIVVATGAATEIAAVQRLAAAARAPRGRLREKLDALTTRLAVTGLGAGVASTLAGLAWRRPPLAVAREAVALGVAAIPEGMPVSATAALVRAMARMRDRGIVVRRLATAEALGAVTVACVDKTGTLTENRMQLEVIALAPGEGEPAGAPIARVRPELLAGLAERAAPAAPAPGPLGAVLVGCILNSDLEYHDNGRTLELAGSATERALVEAARAAGLDPLATRDRWPRSSLTERSADVHYVISEHAGGLAFLKGAPEQVVQMCGVAPATASGVLDENRALAADGLRVLAMAWRPAPGAAWRLLGLLALRDPLRAGSAEAIAAAARAGIRTVMVTGDQRATAEAIARRVGLAGEAVEGPALRALLAAPDAAARLRRVAVVARVAPSDKLAVVEALRAAGEIVAMAGDGINDAPALRAADVGIAVGARASDLARQTADVVLEREDLQSILTAVSEGRAVQDNLRRAIRFQAAGNLGEILLVLGGGLLGQHLIPSLGLLWINLLTDTLPGLALAMAPTSGDLLGRPPVRPDAPILDAADWRRVARDGALLAAGAGAAAVAGGPLAAFGVIGAGQFGYAGTCRARGAPPDRRFGRLVGGSLALHALAVATAPARAVLGVPGSMPLAAAAMAAAAAAPLYLAWRREAAREITCRGAAAAIPDQEALS